MQLRYIIFFPCWLLLNKALKEIQSKEKKNKEQMKEKLHEKLHLGMRRKSKASKSNYVFQVNKLQY